MFQADEGVEAEEGSVCLCHSGLVRLTLTQLSWWSKFFLIETKTAMQAQGTLSVIAILLRALGHH